MDTPVHIALADEHPIFLEGLSSMIRAFPGFKVIIKTDDGQALLDGIAAAATAPDICILDISLPVLNGYDTIKEIKKRWPAIKVLILSMFNTELNVIRTIKVGANGFVLKGCDPNELHNALIAIHSNGHYYSDAMPARSIREARNSILLKLSYREMEFLSLCCTELSYKGMADKMDVSVRTIEGYRNTLYDKLKTNSRIGLVLFALNIGMVPVEKVR